MKSFLKAQSGTNIPIYEKCKEIFQNFDLNKSIRVLTISDGQIANRKKTEKAEDDFVDFCKRSNFAINSQAVHLFTSEIQPDTSALCSLLQINNMITCRFAEISTTESNDEIATKIANLFKNDNLVNGQNMNTKSENVMKFPWESSTQQLTLLPGENVFWLKGMPSEDIKIGDTPVTIQMQSPLTLHQFQSLMAEKIEFIVDHMKILKVVGTKEAGNVMTRILEYFETTEETLTKKSPQVKNSNLERRISIILANIVENENIDDLDSTQKVEYLREASVEKEFPKVAHFSMTSAGPLIFEPTEL
jgi:hypothetical protein